jgi:signal transduction histidine kinase
MPFDLAPMALMPLIERAAAETRSFAQSFQVLVAVQSRIPDATALIDPDRFIQVITNLVSNAAKFSPEGEAVIVTFDRIGKHLRISVADHGPGIPEAFRGRIFEKFAQADGSDSRRLAGTGLGLAIVKSIVEQLDGTVSFDTECGRGTTFHVDLPEWKAVDANSDPVSESHAA